MDSQNIYAASEYINNLLLSRGLLRNGTPIEFAKPSKAEGGLEGTMARVINLIHDMVLRRDRETETLSALSQSLQSLRASNGQQRQNILRLETKATDLDKQLALVMTQKTAAEATLRDAVAKNRALREDMAKLKVTVPQIRAQCANDIRKRDGEISRLKKHLEGRRGREGGTASVGVVVIAPGLKTGAGSISGSINPEIQTSNDSLRQETANHLNELSQSLSKENDALIGLVKDTLSTLRNLQGLPSDGEDPTQRVGDSNVFITSQVSYDNLATDMSEVLEHLRVLLTNPSFVPLEEVEIREDEISRLRSGWEQIEARWREALTLMDGWRKRIMETGDTINLDDLRKGLTLAVDSPLEADQPKSDISILQEHHPAEQENDITIIPESSDESTLSEYDVFLHVDDDGVTERSLSRHTSEEISPRKKEPGKPLFAAPPVLHPMSGSRRRRSLSPRKVSFKAPSPATSTAEGAFDVADDVSLLNFSNLPSSKSTLNAGLDSSEDGETLTVQQKLAHVESEAEEARRREESTSKEERKTGLSIPKLKPGRSSRRTLSPEELEDLSGYA